MNINNRRREGNFFRKKNLIIAFLVFLAIFFFFAREAVGGMLARVGEAVASPFWRAGTALSGSISDTGVLFASKQALSRENRDLRAEIQKLQKDLLGYDAVVSENIDLKKMLGRDVGGREKDFILAGVLSRSSDLPYDVFHVDAGTGQGVPDGALVLAGFSENMLSSTSLSSSPEPSLEAATGKIIAPFASVSKVRLFSSAGEETPVFLGPENISTTLLGTGRGAFTAKLPKDLDIQKGDAAVLPGVEGYLAAVVEATEVDESQAFQLVYLRTPFNPSELRYIVITNTILDSNAIHDDPKTETETSAQ